MFNKFSSVVVAGLVLWNGQLLAGEPSLKSWSREAGRAKALAWLENIGKADADNLKRFEAVWKQGDRTVTDCLVESFLIGNARAAKLLERVRDSSAPAPVGVSEILEDGKRPIFFRANFAVGYAQALNARRAYEESLQTLVLFEPEQVVDPASYLFQRGVAENALLLEAPAEKTFKRLREDVSDVPEQYLKTATAKLAEMKTWKDNDLSAVARQMEAVERRLELARGGLETQKIQKAIIQNLDNLIKDLQAREGPRPKQTDPKAPKLLRLSDELKLIRSIQLKINKRTEQYSRLYQEKEGEQTSDPNIRNELNKLRKQQLQIHKLTKDIARVLAK